MTTDSRATAPVGWHDQLSSLGSPRSSRRLFLLGAADDFALTGAAVVLGFALGASSSSSSSAVAAHPWPWLGSYRPHRLAPTPRAACKHFVRSTEPRASFCTSSWRGLKILRTAFVICAVSFSSWLWISSI